MNEGKDHQLTIQKVGDEWKVVLNADPGKKWKAKKGDTITWKAVGSNVYFEFMNSNLFGEYNYELNDGDELKLTISQNAKKWNYRYSAFCSADMAFASGYSPPEIDLTD